MAADDVYATVAGVVTVFAPGVLANDTDSDDDALTTQLVTDATSGTLVFNSDGSFAYTSEVGFVGEVSFGYRAFDGTSLSNIAIVTITVTAP